MMSSEITKLIIAAAREAGLEPAILLALVEVEASGRAFAVVKGRREPLIRFEGHYFDRRLSEPDRTTARAAGLASPTAGAIRNPPGQAARWQMLERATAIDRRAAYESTSWGVGQVMGAHWSRLGYESVDALVEATRGGINGQIELMLRFIEHAGLTGALRRHDWHAFARGYNGPNYARNSYHLRLSLAYRRHARQLGQVGSDPDSNTSGLLREGMRGERVRHLQTVLCALGHPVKVDSIFGPRTRKAVFDFQRLNKLAIDGVVGPDSQAAMERTLPLSGKSGKLPAWFLRLWQRLRSR